MEPNEFPLKEMKFLLSGPAGPLEVIAKPSNTELTKGISIFCHSNSQQKGGNLDNKVVTTACKAFNHCGLHSIRFNFRGVGLSEGSFENGVGELTDLQAVLKWIKRVNPEMPICLGGVSFGSYVATQATFQWASIYNIKQLISVAPTVDRRDYSSFNYMVCPWLIIQGEEDEVLSSQAVYNWYDTLISHIKITQKNNLNDLPKLIKIPHAGHFFNGQLLLLGETIQKNLQKFPIST